MPSSSRMTESECANRANSYKRAPAFRIFVYIRDTLNILVMKKIVAISILFCLILSAKAEDKPILVTTQWLKENLKDPKVVVLQANFLKFDYDREHIEGARYLWPGWLGPDSPEGALNLPDIKKATEVLQALGISNDTHIVLCHIRNEVSQTTRIFLTLEHFGLRGNVSFLNGGLEAWKKEGYPVTKDVPSVKKGTVKLKAGALIVDKDYVLKTLKSDNAFVVDARLQRFYDGESTGNPRDGHITGAKNIPYTEMVDATNLFKPTDQLQAYFTPVASKDKELVAYCFIGQTASVVYMAGRLLGYNMKLYDGSLQEWSRLEELPMEKTQK
jgi:thiosulfate/3-mercaptopyruvate sulfurtransferase